MPVWIPISCAMNTISSVQTFPAAAPLAWPANGQPPSPATEPSNSSTPMRYKVTGIPTLLVFKGGQVVEQLVGYRPKDAIAQAIDKHVG